MVNLHDRGPLLQATVPAHYETEIVYSKSGLQASDCHAEMVR